MKDNMRVIGSDSAEIENEHMQRRAATELAREQNNLLRELVRRQSETQRLLEKILTVVQNQGLGE